MISTRRGLGMRAAALAVLLALAASCGSDDGDSNSQPDVADPPAEEPAEPAEEPADEPAEPADEPADEPAEPADEPADEPAEPIKVMAIAPTDTEQVNVPEPLIATQAAANRINSEGGINGRMIEVITCNDRNDPNEAGNCARQAVDEGVIAVNGTFSLAGGSRIIPVLEEAGIAYISPSLLSAEDMTSTISFPVSGSIPADYSGVGKLLAQMGATEVQALRLDVEAAAAAEGLIGLGLSTAGLQLAGSVLVPLGTVDLAPQAQAARSGGDGIGLVVEEETATLFLQAAIDAGIDFEEELRVVGSASNVPPSTIERFGDRIDGVGYVSPFPGLDHDDPLFQQAIADMQAIDDDVKLEEHGLAAYYGMLAMAHAAEGLETVDRASLLQAMGEIENLDLGVLTLTTTTPNPIPGFDRVFNSTVYLFEVQDGVAVQLNDEPVDAFAAG